MITKLVSMVHKTNTEAKLGQRKRVLRLAGRPTERTRTLSFFANDGAWNFSKPGSDPLGSAPKRAQMSHGPHTSRKSKGGYHL